MFDYKMHSEKFSLKFHVRHMLKNSHLVESITLNKNFILIMWLVSGIELQRGLKT